MSENENLFSKDELFKIHFCDTLEKIFNYFPDIYQLDLNVKNKFDRPSLDVYPKIYIDSKNKIPNVILEPHYFDLESFQQLQKAVSAPHSNLKNKLPAGNLSHNGNGLSSMPNILKITPGILLNWHENPKLCTLTVDRDLCNYLEFLEYLIFSINEFDKEEIEAHIETNKQNKSSSMALHSFERNQFTKSKNEYLGVDILFKQEKYLFSSAIPKNTLSQVELKPKKNKDKI